MLNILYMSILYVEYIICLYYVLNILYMSILYVEYIIYVYIIC